MKNRKRIAALIALALCLSFVLSACSSGEGNNTAPPATRAPATQPPVSASTATPEVPLYSYAFNPVGYPIVSEPITISIIYPRRTTSWNDLLYNQKMEEVTGITFDYTEIMSEDYDNQLALMLASRDHPDVYWGWLSAAQEQEFGGVGDFIDLSPYIDSYMPFLNEWFAENPTHRNLLKSFDGNTYSLPYLIGTPTILGTTHYIRTDMMAKAGVTRKPSTVEDYYDILVAMRDANIDDDFIPLMMRGADRIGGLQGFLFPSFGEAYEAEFADDGRGNVVYNYTSDQYRRFLEFVKRLYTEKLFDQEFLTRTIAEAQAHNALNLNGISDMGTLYTLDNFESGTYDVELYPPLTSQWSSERKVPGFNAVSTGLGVITSKNQYPEATIRWLDMNYYLGEGEIPGLEGTGVGALMGWLGPVNITWERTSPGFYRRIIPSDTPLSEVDYMTQVVAPGNGPMANVFWDMLEGSVSLAMKGVESLEHLFPYLRTLFPNNYLRHTPEEQAVVNRYADIQSFVFQMRASFVVGEIELNDSNWNSFVNEVNRMGIRDVLAAKQSAYDRMRN